jgi:two-component system LytT family response regulator
MTALIVDDEPYARRCISDFLSKDHEMELLGTCRNGREAIAFVEQNEPDIVFLDIEMPGINGIEVANAIKSYKCVVIFTTAYDGYALKAFEVEAVNYLLKPFGSMRFEEALNAAKDIVSLKKQAEFSKNVMNLYNNYKESNSPHLTEFVLKDNGIERIIKANDVCFLEARSVYVIVRTEEDAHLYRAALNLLEKQLPVSFLRVHRSFIINTNFIETYKYLNNNTFAFQMKNGEKIVSSRSYKDGIKNALGSVG